MCSSSSSSSFFFSLVYSIHTAIPWALALVYASPSHQTKLTLIVLGEHLKYTLSLYSSRFGECFVSLADDPQETLPSAYPRSPKSFREASSYDPRKSRIPPTHSDNYPTLPCSAAHPEHSC